MEKETLEKPGTEQEMNPFRKVRLKKRPGFETRRMRWIFRCLYPFFHCRTRLTRELEDSTEPVVFVANHYNLFGPLSFIVSVPLVSDAWINEEISNRESAAESLRPGLKQLLPFLSDRRIGWLSDKLGGFVAWVLTQLGMIPVNRNKPSTLISTMRKSIASLEEGHNLLIFPETGLPEYSLTSVTPFFSGFVTLGRLYYRKTGRCLRFCPCYIDEQHRRIRMGQTVAWDPEAEPAGETERISDELNLRIRKMAAENRGVEKEKSKPVPRTIQFFCNLVRTLLLIPLVTMLSLPNPPMILLFYGISEGLRILFNAVSSTYAASNRLSILYSHGIGTLTDLGMFFYLSAVTPRLGILIYMLIIYFLVALVSNVRSFGRYRRCAGINYFDALSSNLLLVICLQQMLHVPLSRLILRILTAAALLFLACSAGFTVALNARIGKEEEGEFPV